LKIPVTKEYGVKNYSINYKAMTTLCEPYIICCYQSKVKYKPLLVSPKTEIYRVVTCRYSPDTTEISGSQSLYNFYKDQVTQALKETFSYKNFHEIPKLTKIILNRSPSDPSNTKGFLQAVQEMALITGQKPIITKAKKSIASFQITKGDKLGIKVSLRSSKMYAFLHRLINLSLPRIRDFQGLKWTSFDGTGNYNFGIDDQLMFPEMNPESIQRTEGLQISIITTATTNKEAYTLLKMLGMPFQTNELWD